MAKTITLRVDDRLYKAIKHAASTQNRTVSNYLETVARSFILEEQFVRRWPRSSRILSLKRISNPLSMIGSRAAGSSLSGKFRLAETKTFLKSLQKLKLSELHERLRLSGNCRNRKDAYKKRK
ncbi:hypothetical protein [Leptospira alstonii]|nr:hypothetical protein [Leptospira alstonii]